MKMVPTYDGISVVSRLSKLDRAAHAAFAAACAEALLPLASRSSNSVRDQLAVALSGVWTVIAGGRADLEVSRTLAQSLVPNDFGDWTFEMGYLQNTASSVAYAAMTVLEDSSRFAELAGQQLYEVADYAAQHQLHDLDLNVPTAEAALTSQPVVQAALEILDSLLGWVEKEGWRWEDVRYWAAETGEPWAATFP